MDKISMITLLLARAYTDKKTSEVPAVIQYKGVTTTELYDGATMNPITINGNSYTAVDGDVVFYQSTAYAYDGSVWQATMSLAQIITALEDLEDKIGDLTDLTTTDKDSVVDAINELVTTVGGKQDTLTFDTVPTDGSTNPVESNGVYDALATKQNAEDNNLQTTSKNVVGGINELKSGLTNLDNEVNGDATTYPYADVITIDDAVPANVADCKVKIDPVHDLHGQSAPYVGGAGGKQLIPLTVDAIKSANTGGTWVNNTYTIRNVDCTIDVDDGGNVSSITLNGTCTAGADAEFNLPLPTLSAGDYILNGTPSGLSGVSALYVQVDGGAFKYDNGAGVNFSVVSVVNACRMIVVAGKTVTNVKYYPMIRLASITDGTYAPYTNICPITGHTEASVEVTDGDETTKTYTIALGDTIYGGTVDFNTGIMTVTHKYVDLGQYDYSVTDIDNQYFTTISPRYKAPASLSVKPNWICDSYDIGLPTYTNSRPLSNYTMGCFGDFSQNNIVFVRDPRCSSAAEMKTALNGVQLCYELATPTTVQLTPQQIQLLQGQNTLTASTGQISVTANGVSGAIGQVQTEVTELAESVVDRFDDVIGWSENKNLIPLTLKDIKNSTVGGTWNGNKYTIDGVEYEVIIDTKGCVSKIRANGTPTPGSSSATFTIMNRPNINPGTAIISTGTDAKGSSTTYCVVTLDGAWGNQQNVYDSKTVTVGISKVQLKVYAGYTAENLDFRPMVRNASISDPTYEPYHELIGKSVNGLLDRVPTAPSADGTYSLQVTVASGVPTYSWVSNA